jgi:uncharacterized membrane protein
MSSPALPRTSPAQLGTPPALGQLLLGLAGGALLIARGRFPDHARSAATVAGLALLGAAARRPLGDVVRSAGTQRRNAEVRLSFVIAQPVERVFNFCRDFENFPRFIGALRQVHDYGDGRSHWCASTPSGNTVEWNTVITKYVPNSVIGWQSVGASPVHSAGLIRVKPENGGTSLQVMLSYRVNDSRLADSVAALATPPREQQLERDIRRLVNYLERAGEEELATGGS